MNSIMKNFQKRALHNLSHDRKFSCDMGQLVPILCEEVLPGDTFSVNSDMLVRLSPLVTPVMHEINCFTYYFFVPNRLIWADWESFITGGVDGKNASVHPFIGFNNLAISTLADYFGFPTGVAADVNMSALPIRAYNKIYNDWFRNQTLQTEQVISTASGQDTTTNTTLLNKNWERDYFTSALPWTQRGDPVSVGMGGTADVVLDDALIPVGWHTPGIGTEIEHPMTKDTGATTTFYADDPDTAGDQLIKASLNDATGTADLTTGTNITINDLRLAFQLQKWLEKNARAGARYYESIMAHFGVQTSDYRLQRSEYLGGGKSPVIVSEVLQTSKTESGAPQGNMAGHAFSAQRSHEFTKSFEEHGLIIGLFCVMPRTAYQEGLSRCLTRSTRYDYYWPLFAHLGEQAILKKEIYLGTNNTTNEEVWAYQGRYDEYRRRESSCHGVFRTNFNTWHMTRILGSLPTLNSAFVTADPTKRIHAVTNTETLWVYLKNNVRAIRPIPRIGEPGLIDH